MRKTKIRLSNNKVIIIFPKETNRITNLTDKILTNYTIKINTSLNNPNFNKE